MIKRLLVYTVSLLMLFKWVVLTAQLTGINAPHTVYVGVLYSFITTIIAFFWMHSTDNFISSSTCLNSVRINRANRLLRSNLSWADWWSYRLLGVVYVRGSYTNKRYRVGNSWITDPDGYRMCVLPGVLYIPTPDIILARIIMLKCAEQEVLSVAKYPFGGPKRTK